MKNSTIFAVLLCVIALFTASCDSNISNSDGKLYVVTTTGMIGDAVRNVGGDLVKVDALMGPGVDPHSKKITASDTHKLARADVIFYNGLHLEGKMVDTFIKMKKYRKIYAVTEDIDRKLLHHPPGMTAVHDPHIWFNVALWQKAVAKIEKVLCEVDPENKKAYNANAAAYLKKLDKLHKWVTLEIAKIPKPNRVLITAHDAFGYFGQAYDIEVRGLQGISTAAEYGVKDQEQLIALLVKRKIHAVFVESSVPQKYLEAVVEMCRAQGHRIRIGGSLFSDAMGEAETPEGKYIGMVEHNVRTIVANLVPAQKKSSSEK